VWYMPGHLVLLSPSAVPPFFHVVSLGRPHDAETTHSRPPAYFFYVVASAHVPLPALYLLETSSPPFRMPFPFLSPLMSFRYPISLDGCAGAPRSLASPGGSFLPFLHRFVSNVRPPRVPHIFDPFPPPPPRPFSPLPLSPDHLYFFDICLAERSPMYRTPCPDFFFFFSMCSCPHHPLDQGAFSSPFFCTDPLGLTVTRSPRLLVNTLPCTLRLLPLLTTDSLTVPG